MDQMVFDSEKTAREFVDSLDPASRENLRWAIEDVVNKGHVEDLLDAVRRHIERTAEERSAKVFGVVFRTMDFDDGDFYTEMSARLVYEDPSMEDDEEEISEASDALREFGRVATDAGLGVYLATGGTDEDDYSSDVERRMVAARDNAWAARQAVRG